MVEIAASAAAPVSGADDQGAADAAKAADSKLSWAQLGAYGLPFVSISVLMMPVAVIAPNLYVKERGVPLAVMGVILMAARIFDAVADQTVGFLSDMSRQWLPGGRKGWLVLGALVGMPSIYLLFTPPTHAGAVYFATWSLASYLAWAMLLIPYFAWGAELSRGYHERTRITTVRSVLGQIGGFIYLGVPAALVYMGLAANTEIDLNSSHYVGLLLILLLPLTILPAVLFAPQGVGQKATPSGLWSALKAVGSNGPMQIYAGALLISDLGYGIFATVIFIYVDGYLGLGPKLPFVVMVSSVATLVSLPFWERMSRWIGKKGSVVLSWAVQALCLFGLVFTQRGPAGLWPMTTLITVSSFFIGSALVVSPSILGDIIDYDTLKTRGYRAGAFFAVYSLVDKMVVAIGGGAAFLLLGLFGYDAAHAKANGPDQNLALLFVFAVIPGLLRMGSLILLWRYPLTARRQTIIRRRLEQRESRAARDETAAKGVS